MLSQQSVSFAFFCFILFHFYPPPPPMGCGAAKATGLGFGCFVVINPRVLSASTSWFWGFLLLLFHIPQISPPSPGFNNILHARPDHWGSPPRSSIRDLRAFRQSFRPSLLSPPFRRWFNCRFPATGAFSVESAACSGLLVTCCCYGRGRAIFSSMWIYGVFWGFFFEVFGVKLLNCCGKKWRY